MPEHQHLRVFTDTTAPLRAMAHREQVAVNTIFQGLWALCLSRYCGQQEVLFGATESGRPAELPGVEAIAGMFVNVVPLRARISPGQNLIAWLKELQARRREAKKYEYTPFARIREWSEVPPGVPLFENLLVYETYPRRARHLGPRNRELLEVHDVRYFKNSHYPLMVRIVPAHEMVIEISSQPGRFQPVVIARMLSHLHHLLLEILADPQRPLHALSMLSAAERHQCLVEWNEQTVQLPAAGPERDGETPETLPRGRPIPVAGLYVLSRALEPLPQQAVGELWISGPAASEGHLKKTRSTAERFVPDPFSTRAGARLFSSGDLARYRSDGRPEFLDRLDQPVRRADEDLKPATDVWLAPRTPVEEELARIWSELLRVDRVGVNDHFFQLGGQSLVALRIIARIRESWHIELPVRSLFDAPTVARMAVVVEATRRGHPAPHHEDPDHVVARAPLHHPSPA